MTNKLAGVLTIALGLLIGNLITTGTFALLGNRYEYKMIQLLPESERPDFKVSPTDFTPNKYEPPVSLHNEKTENNPSGFVCSGAVISNEYVVTAAHCLVDEHGDMLKTIIVKSVHGDESGFYSSQIGIPVGVNQRADYALIKGDFSLFTKVMIDTKLTSVLGDTQVLAILDCGLPWGSGFSCYKIMSGMKPYHSQLATAGILFPGMSGGPVLAITLSGPVLFAVNSATMTKGIIFSPLVGIFETLGIKEIK